MKALRANAVLLAAGVSLCCVLYPAALWAFAQVVVPTRANGSLVARADGSLVGSSQVAQAFTADGYFWPRPSAVGYNAAAAGGSNWGASNPKLRERAVQLLGPHVADRAPVPADFVTASGSGLDPHITLRNARWQLPRVAAARSGAAAARIDALLTEVSFAPLGGLAGEPLVNVLDVNLRLDAAFGGPPPR